MGYETDLSSAVARSIRIAPFETSKVYCGLMRRDGMMRQESI
jgi:hypothetical protein